MVGYQSGGQRRAGVGLQAVAAMISCGLLNALEALLRLILRGRSVGVVEDNAG